MLWWILFLIIVFCSFIYVAFIEYPVISTAVALIVLGITIISHEAKKSKSSEEDERETIRNLAVRYIEEAYDMAINHPEIKPESIKLFYETGGGDTSGFVVFLRTNIKVEGSETLIKLGVQQRLKDYSEFSCKSDWQIDVTGYRTIILRREWISSSLNKHYFKFQAEAWDRIRQEHPSWNVIDDGDSGEYDFIQFSKSELYSY